jgi:hypothetical protein
MTLDHILASLALSATVAFVITLVALLSSPMMWHKENL